MRSRFHRGARPDRYGEFPIDTSFLFLSDGIIRDIGKLTDSCCHATAVTRYPPTVTTTVGSDTGAVSNTVPTPAMINPIFRSTLKNLGVGAFILSKILLILLILIIKNEKSIHIKLLPFFFPVSIQR
ncbi:MAG: hypothetical protein IPN89_06545 [Saprospiraceae bacterium]|nr:hypothetical protein [Saprospiraceae bacterium]